MLAWMYWGGWAVALFAVYLQWRACSSEGEGA